MTPWSKDAPTNHHLLKPSPALQPNNFYTFLEFNQCTETFLLLHPSHCRPPALKGNQSSSAAMAKKKAAAAAAPPEQFTGSSLIICRNK
jgi:hypothetical protein